MEMPVPCSICTKMEIYGKIKKDIEEILRKLCEQKHVEIVEANACSDHIHMLVCITSSLSVAQFMGFLKGKKSDDFRQTRQLEIQVWQSAWQDCANAELERQRH